MWKKLATADALLLSLLAIYVALAVCPLVCLMLPLFEYQQKVTQQDRKHTPDCCRAVEEDPVSIVPKPQATEDGCKPRPGEIVPDNFVDMGPWPESLPVFHGMTRYRSTRFTQAIYTLNHVPFISRVTRTQLPIEWQVPCGMDYVKGWRADLYRAIPDGYLRQWQALLPVSNQFGYIQYERGYTRSYPDKTFFVLAMSNADGKPFEIRVREKQGGNWQSYIAWKDVASRPAGYCGLVKKCNDCHSKAGTGRFGEPMISGADTVFSDPFDFNRVEVRFD